MTPKPLASRKRLLLIVLLLLVLGAVYALMPKDKTGEAAGPGGGGGPRSREALVSTAPVKLANLPITQDAIGNVEAIESVSIQPQISGLLKKIHFTQGQNVSKGQLLFEIDARIQSASLDQMKAMLARSQASIRQARANLAQAATQTAVAEANIKRDRSQLTFARQEAARTQKLLEQKLESREAADRAQTTIAAAEATLAANQAALTNARAQVEAEQAALQTAISSANADQAAVESARIQLGFTQIYAPIAGKTGPLLLNVGNTVQANASTLVNIKQLSPIFVAFSVAEKELKAFQEAMRGSGIQVKATSDAGLTEAGQLVFIDNTINKNNGTVFLKARFANLNGRLWPGQFVNVTAQLGIQQGALSIPAEAVQKGPTGDFVYVVKEGKAQMQPVTVARISSGVAVIAKGLSANQQVVVTGQGALAPDAPVKVVDPKAPPQASAQPAAQGEKP